MSSCCEVHGGSVRTLACGDQAAAAGGWQAKAPISNIYAAGPNATIYTLGMRRNYRRGYITDFARIEGLPGAARFC